VRSSPSAVSARALSLHYRVDADLNCIKGGGACHLREKVLAEAAITWIIVADYRKNSLLLGTSVCIGLVHRR
jgi:ribose 5-phosphate isomerase